MLVEELQDARERVPPDPRYAAEGRAPARPVSLGLWNHAAPARDGVGGKHNPVLGR